MNTNIKNQPVVRNVLNIISEKGLKQKAVAKKAGYSNQQFCDMLNGRKIIRPYDVLAIATALEVDANALFGSTAKERE